MTKKLAVLPGDGIGPEVINEAVKVLERLRRDFGLKIELENALVGGIAYEAHKHPLPDATLKLAKQADAVLLGAVGGNRWDTLARELRPEKALLTLRSELRLFANLRPAILYPQLASASTLKPDVVAGLDLLIVRELTGDIYFGEPRGVRTLESGERQGFNTMVYAEHEVERGWRSPPRASAAVGFVQWKKPMFSKLPAFGARWSSGSRKTLPMSN
jgi:3-isopropylmalate dehydrogenase